MTNPESEFPQCCACDGTENVRNALLLDFEAPPDFHGWGCFVCGLPMRGAIAVLCDDCAERGAEPRYICTGRYVREGLRLPLDGYERKPFDHIEAKHPELREYGYRTTH